MNGKFPTLGEGDTSIFLRKPGKFDILNCETETSKHFKRKSGTVRH